ncbi:transglycosylase domain-containing protein [Cryptosporangium sp. NPDC048952]|uniref:transglycosylase domain-containing protein n=1 Tax=Cryptosporangium sp. NPDC048952 TaxID=3363961 RepID=UPI00371A31B6
MSYGQTPEGGDSNPGARERSSGTVYGGSASTGAAKVGGGTVYGGSSGGTTYGSSSASGGTTYGSSAASGNSSSGSSSGTTYGSPAAGRSGTTYGSSGGTTYGSGGTTYGSGASGTTYGSTAVGDRPAGVGPRSRAAALEDDQLLPEFGGMPPNDPKVRKPGRRKKILIGVGIGTAVCMLLGMVGGGVAYASTDLPPIPKVSGTTQIKYSDNSTFATFSAENRVEVPLNKVPKHVQQAVTSVEDPDFDTNKGVSFRGTARAVWGLVKGDDGAGGGSTITQQYIRNVFNMTKERSYTRKVKEIILARKLSDSVPKEDILKGYLNTIYFGRGASGIQQASQAYFGKDVDKLTVEEGAVIAAVIKDPTNFDPANKLESAKGRWGYVLDQMVAKGYIDQAARSAMTYPKYLEKPKRAGQWRDGSTGILGQKIESELKQIGFNEEDINTGGLTVFTTISKPAQAAAAKASQEALDGQDKDMATATVSIDPKSGAVRAYYGGDRGYGNLDLASAAAPHPAGSSFKPYVLAKGVEDGYSIDSLWDGTSGQKFEDRAEPLTNSGNDNSCGKQCSLTSATVKSLNTVYWALTLEVGAKNVAKLAEKAGIKTLDRKPIDDIINDGKLNSGLGIGQFSVSVLDQAAGYATFASYGTYHQPYFITKVLDADGKTVLWDHANNVAQPVQAFDKSVGRDVSYVMQQVYDSATKNKIGRDAAIKTGTQQYQNTEDNAHAWMCGYTPNMATAVWVGSGTDKDIRLKDRKRGGIVYGSGIPGIIWSDYMKSALKKTEVEEFQSALHEGDKAGNAPEEEPDPTPSDTPDPNDPDGTNPDAPWYDGGESPSPSDGTNGDGQQGDNGDGQNQDGGGFFNNN